MASIAFKNLAKSYDETHVVKGINLDVKHGEFIVLLGPSGCGKSTTLRMLAGLEDISGGEIYIDELPVNGLHPIERNIAMVFQSYALYPHMTVEENIGFGLENMKVEKAKRKEMVATVAEVLELTPLLQRKPKDLSGGQRQRVAMGRAMVRTPKVFLFDEPLSNLDAKLRGQMRKEIRALHERVKTTVIYVTHDQVEAMTLADRIVILNNGEIEQVGTPKDIFENPRTQFVAKFIGSPEINIFDIDLMGMDKYIADEYVPTSAKTMGIRPQVFTLDADEIPTEYRCCMQAEVIGLEHLGAVTHLECYVENKKFNAEVKYLDDDVKGITKLYFDFRKIHYFDTNNITILQ